MCADCPHEKTRERIRKLFGNRRYFWASATLGGIHRMVEDRQHVTPGQITAIDNIEIAGKRRRR